MTALSPLDSLATRRAEIAEGLHLDLPVPRWNNPVIVIRYQPLEHERIREIGRLINKARNKSLAEVNLNIDGLVEACVEVFATLPDDPDPDNPTEYSLLPGNPEGPKTRIDADLAENLGLPRESSPRDIVKDLFFTEGDILMHGAKLARWSGYKMDEVNEEALGGS